MDRGTIFKFMNVEKQSQIFFRETYNEYTLLKKRVWIYFQKNYHPISKIKQSESEMSELLQKELKRIKIHRLTGQNILLEIRKLIQLFYYQERGEKILFNDMNLYMKEFFNRNNREIFKKSPFEGKPVLEALKELVSIRLKLPKSGPEEVFKKWLPKQFEKALDHIPEPILKEGGFGKVCRVMGGVFLYTLSDLDESVSSEEVRNRMEKALKGGYYYGMFYPLIDDILDHSQVFKSHQKKDLIKLLNHWIVGDFTPPNGLSTIPSMILLEDILKKFHKLFPLESNYPIYKAALILHFSQIEDAHKDFQTKYSNEELYVPIIIKASYTRILAAAIGGVELKDSLTDHLIESGLVFQMIDDFQDWSIDYNHKLFTPFTYYLLSPSNQSINPFSLYLSSLRIYLTKFSDDSVLTKLIMRRLAISIQRFNDQGSSDELDESFWSVINQNQEIGEIVKRIHYFDYKILDPDADFTKSIDCVVNRGR